MSLDQMLALSIRADVPLIEQADDSFIFRTVEVGPITFTALSPGLKAAFKQLAAGGVTEQQLSAIVLQAGEPAALMMFYQHLARLTNLGLVCHTLRLADRPLVTIVPMVQRYRFRANAIDPDQKYTLSRFAYCHQVQRQWVLESPLGLARLTIHDGQANRLIAELAQPQSAGDLAQIVTDWPADIIAQFLNLLANAHLLVPVKSDQQTAEETDPALSQWDFHDLLFHARSRSGRHNNPYGGTFRFRGQFNPLPVVKSRMSEEVIPLYRPDLEQLKQSDRPFTAVLEQRKSIREYAEQPITDRELGEFLYRSARVKYVIPAEPGEMEYSLRPYPGGGAIHELEIYPVIGNCLNLPAGLYHYEPLEHQLSKVSDKNRYVEALLYLAWLTSDRRSQPQVYFVITARFQRVQWKYQSLAYALSLKHVGALYQTMYLVATAMGLAPCALGGGDSDLFALASGLDYYTEASIGEFLLGSQGNVADRPNGKH